MRCVVRGAWFAVCGVWCVVCGVRCAVRGLRCAVCGAWFAVCGVWCVVCGVRCAVRGRYWVLGIGVWVVRGQGWHRLSNPVQLMLRSGSSSAQVALHAGQSVVMLKSKLSASTSYFGRICSTNPQTEGIYQTKEQPCVMLRRRMGGWRVSGGSHHAIIEVHTTHPSRFTLRTHRDRVDRVG